jgi:hypothetical protein
VNVMLGIEILTGAESAFRPPPELRWAARMLRGARGRGGREGREGRGETADEPGEDPERLGKAVSRK